MATRVVGFLLAAVGVACGGDPHFDDPIEGTARPAAVLAADSARQRAARVAVHAPQADPGKQVLFGDLHVHSSYSWDGFLFTLPLTGGEGAHPPADACDFARHCSSLDFFALTDHAETLMPDLWSASKESVRQCNAVAGEGDNPDLVAFMGFEWSQAGLTPETHWGHRNLIFKDTAEAALPTRAIGSGPNRELRSQLAGMVRTVRWLAPSAWGRFTAYADYLDAANAWPVCEEGVDVRALADSCQDVAFEPDVLHEKLDQWGFDVLEIPHGMTWGTYTPVGSDVAKHLDPRHYDPDKQRLIEIMSGHGNSEEYRDFRPVEFAPDGSRSCPEPTADYLPCCWQAGEIMRARCGELSSQECERRVALARSHAASANVRPHQVFPDAPLEDWLDCGQCRDCMKPSFGYRPRESVQYAMSLSTPDPADESAEPLRFRYGFIGASDVHSSRPGTGYKQIERTMMTDVSGKPSGILRRFVDRPPTPMDDPTMPLAPKSGPIGVVGSDMRVQSFLFPGGLAAVHAKNRSREAIWDAMQRREAYGTSGPRILLWFDLLNAGEEPLPMGSEATLAHDPKFSVRAVGSLEQQPGCPAASRNGLPAERLERLCRGECFHPGDQRRVIEAIEIVRIRPQVEDGEAIAPRIEDPWLRHECPGDPSGCSFEFEDPAFAAGGRDVLYYARAIEEPSMALNGNPLEAERDAEGRTIAVTLCRGDEGEDGCPAPVRERAWSSPIFVDHPGAAGAVAKTGSMDSLAQVERR
ncbi:MAG: DUF3604 domain-containing protein [Myxococcota bacterium]|jgi:hypothetical protein|nr:DUF3604 domain-containing protein [Myxococcota bacterium]